MLATAIESARSLIAEKLGTVEGLSFHDLLQLMPSDDGLPEVLEANVMVAYVAVSSLLDDGFIKLYPFIRRGGKYFRPAQIKGVNPATDEWVLCLTINIPPETVVN
jgi:hypothetical protein